MKGNVDVCLDVVFVDQRDNTLCAKDLSVVIIWSAVCPLRARVS